MAWYLVFHILGVIIWIGGLMDLTRLVGYHVKEEVFVQARLSNMEFRMYWFVATPGMVLAVVMGIFLFFKGGGVPVYFGGPSSWFIMKFLLAMGLILIHFVFGRFLMDLKMQPRQMNPARFKILHGLTGLMVVGIIIMVFVKPF